MKKFLEKSHLYFLLYYFAVGDFLVYYYASEFPYGGYDEFYFELSFSLFFMVLIVFDIFILIACAKCSVKKPLIPMLLINTYFAFHYFINIPEQFFLQDQNWQGIWQVFSMPFYVDRNSDIVIVVDMLCFFILTVVNIILLYVKRKPKTIEDNKK